MTTEDTMLPLLIEIRNFLESLNGIHLKPFLANWPSTKCVMRSVLPHSLPVLSYLPAVVKATAKKTELLVNMLTPWRKSWHGVNHIQQRIWVLDFLRNLGGRRL